MTRSYIIVASNETEFWTGVEFVNGEEPGAFAKAARWRTLAAASEVLSALAFKQESLKFRGATVRCWKAVTP